MQVCRLLTLLVASSDAEQCVLVLFGWMHYSPHNKIQKYLAT